MTIRLEEHEPFMQVDYKFFGELSEEVLDWVYEQEVDLPDGDGLVPVDIYYLHEPKDGTWMKMLIDNLPEFHLDSIMRGQLPLYIYIYQQ